ncbi:MAG: SMP-30/gluconolactonase/LRE family protein [Sphingomonadaceae bacterium]
MDADMVSPGFERILPPNSQLDAIATGLYFGEGPVWNAREGALYWTEIGGDRIWKWTPGVGSQVFMNPSGKADGLTLDREGRLIVAGWSSRRVWRVEHDGSTTTLASHYLGVKLNTPNDVVVKSDGSIYWTDSAGGLYVPGFQYDGQDVQRYLDWQGVYRISKDGEDISLLVEDFGIPNGLCFSPDETLMYINDTERYHIRVFDVQSDGTLANGRVFYELVGNEPGHADGMKVDVEGNVYCSGPAGIHVVSPQGKLLGRLRVPGVVTNMAWGDSDWRTMFITTHTTVYRVRLSIPGIPVGQA